MLVCELNPYVFDFLTFICPAVLAGAEGIAAGAEEAAGAVAVPEFVGSGGG